MRVPTPLLLISANRVRSFASLSLSFPNCDMRSSSRKQFLGCNTTNHYCFGSFEVFFLPLLSHFYLKAGPWGQMALGGPALSFSRPGSLGQVP